MRGILIFLLSLGAFSPSYAASKDDVYKYCTEYSRLGEAYCTCILGTPYQEAVQSMKEKKIAFFNERQGRFVAQQERLLSDPSLDMTQLQQICAIAEETYRANDVYAEREKDGGKMSPQERKDLVALQKQAQTKMHEILHAGRMSSTVYRAMSTLSGFCLTRYDMAKQKVQHEEELRQMDSGDVHLDPRTFVYDAGNDGLCKM